jgi:uncharacterized protein
LEKSGKYTLELHSLKNQDYEYLFQIDDAFFVEFGTNLVEGGNLQLQLKLSKSERMIQLFFYIKGAVKLICDRSLEEFEYPIATNEKLILKYGEQAEQIDDQLEIITRNTNYIDISQYIYEYIGVQIPMKKLHPKFQNEDESEGNLLVYSSDTQTNTMPDEESEEVDPRWQALKNLKNNLN